MFPYRANNVRWGSRWRYRNGHHRLLILDYNSSFTRIDCRDGRIKGGGYYVLGRLIGNGCRNNPLQLFLALGSPMFASIVFDSLGQALCRQRRRSVGRGWCLGMFRERSSLLLFWCNFWLSRQFMLSGYPTRTFSDLSLPTRAGVFLASRSSRLTGDLWAPCLSIPHLFRIFAPFLKGRLCWLNLAWESSRDFR